MFFCQDTSPRRSSDGAATVPHTQALVIMEGQPGLMGRIVQEQEVQYSQPEEHVDVERKRHHENYIAVPL
ncbi:uncharacterized [Tachysurus ichikawai]